MRCMLTGVCGKLFDIECVAAMAARGARPAATVRPMSSQAAFPSAELPHALPHAVHRLRSARLARSSKPFLARGGPRGERCAGCRLLPSHCLCALRPDVPVELTSSVEHSVDFRREAFDAAVVYSPQPGSKRAGQHLFDEQLTPVCAPHLLDGSNALNHLNDLAQHTLLHPSRDQRDWTNWLNAVGGDLSSIRQNQYFDTLDLAMTVAAQGSGVAIGDWSLISDDLKAGRLAMPFDFKVRTGAAYYLVCSPRSELSAPLRELMRWLVQQTEH